MKFPHLNNLFQIGPPLPTQTDLWLMLISILTALCLSAPTLILAILFIRNSWSNYELLGYTFGEFIFENLRAVPVILIGGAFFLVSLQMLIGFAYQWHSWRLLSTEGVVSEASVLDIQFLNSSRCKVTYRFTVTDDQGNVNEFIQGVVTRRCPEVSALTTIRYAQTNPINSDIDEPYPDLVVSRTSNGLMVFSCFINVFWIVSGVYIFRKYFREQEAI